MTEEMNAMLMTPILDDEIKDAAMQIGGLKAPVRTNFRGFSIKPFGRILWET